MNDDLFVVVGPSALGTVGPPGLAVGPLGLRGAKHRGMYLRHVLQINTYQLVLYRDIQKWVGYWILRSVLTSTKNGGKIWILRDRGKVFFERPKKVHFWKNQFQNLLQNSDFWNFAAIFIYIGYMNWSGSGCFCIGRWRSKKIFLRSDPSGPRSKNQTISILICS